jgi:xanthine dehydrogenase YagS FAD-binding subunit
MKSFDYYKVTSVKDAVALLGKNGEKAAILAGGSDLYGLMKDRVEGAKMKVPQHLIDIKGIKELTQIKEQKGSLRIGAATTITDMVDSDLISKKYPVLAQAARQVAVPQIRNVGTLGGNLCQRPRCWYFRGALFAGCLRKGGGNCYAQDGENQYHAILENDICCMVYPSDLAPALMALDARVEIAGQKGTRVVPIAQFYVTPQNNILRETVLTPQELLVAVEIPAPAQGSKGAYVKLKERQAFDFPIASVAVNLTLKGNAVGDARVVFSGLAPVPVRSMKAEAALKGRGVKDSVAAACNAAVEGVRPLSKNGYKVQVAKGILEQALIILG